LYSNVLVYLFIFCGAARSFKANLVYSNIVPSLRLLRGCLRCQSWCKFFHLVPTWFQANILEILIFFPCYSFYSSREMFYAIICSFIWFCVYVSGFGSMIFCLEKGYKMWLGRSHNSVIYLCIFLTAMIWISAHIP
jgi:hypothetical protein